MTRVVERLLDATRDALLAGDFAALADLADRVAAAADRLGQLDPQDADRLRSKAERNAHLLLAAGRGLRAARDRLVEIRTGPCLATYDQQGRKAHIAGPALSLGRF